MSIGSYANGKYNGGKNGDGMYQRIINLIPPHKVWVEACAGSAAITRKIYAAAQSFVIEIEPLQAGKLKKELKDRAVVINSDFMTEIGRIVPAGIDTFIFADPPYLKEVRTSQKDIYKIEWDTNDHRHFINWLKEREEKIMITHPVCDMYLYQLAHWNKIEYTYMSRGGLRNDCIWYNYTTPEKLHDYSYAGSTYTDRQRIKRKINREIEKLSMLPGIERNAIIAEINRYFGNDMPW